MVVRLAAHDCPVTRRSLAKSEGITGAYADRLLQLLKKADIVRSIMGPSGGYVLTDTARTMTVADVYEALEGPFHAVPCQKEACDRKDSCAVASVWRGAAQSFMNELDNHPIAHLAQKRRFHEIPK
jgi:Rrf2 family protein